MRGTINAFTSEARTIIAGLEKPALPRRGEKYRASALGLGQPVLGRDAKYALFSIYFTQTPSRMVCFVPIISMNVTVGFPSSNPTYGRTVLQLGHSGRSLRTSNVAPASVPPFSRAARIRTFASA